MIYTNLSGLADSLLAVLVEDVHVVHIEDHLDLIADLVARAWVHPGDENLLAGLQIDEDFIAHQFGHIHLGVDRLGRDAGRGESGVVDVFGADAEDDLLAGVRHEHIHWSSGICTLKVPPSTCSLAVVFAQLGREEVHRWRADEAGDEQVVGLS